MIQDVSYDLEKLTNSYFVCLIVLQKKFSSKEEYCKYFCPVSEKDLILVNDSEPANFPGPILLDT